MTEERRKSLDIILGLRKELRESRERVNFLEGQLRELIARAEVFVKFILNQFPAR